MYTRNIFKNLIKWNISSTYFKQKLNSTWFQIYDIIKEDENYTGNLFIVNDHYWHFGINYANSWWDYDIS